MSRAYVEVAPGVLVMTSRRYATTSTVILGRGEALVVDPAWDPDELAGITSVLAEIDVACTAGLATHVHYDHVLWDAGLPDVPRWASDWTCDALAAHRDEILAPLGSDFPAALLDLAGRLTPVPAAVLPWPAREVIVHEHDAHARGHLAIEVPDSGVLVAGDMLSDVELPYPDPDAPDLSSYLAGLDRLADVIRRSRLLIPGHGSPTDDPVGRLDADRRYLDAILAGRAIDDPRIGNPEMAELHESNLRLAR